MKLKKRTKIEKCKTFNLHVKNNNNYFANNMVVSNCHGVRGAILKKLLTEHGKHILYRFGLTGTLPEEQVDLMSVKVSLGEVKYTIKAKELMDRDFLAKLDIDIIQLDEDVRDRYAKYVEECNKIFKKPDSYIAYKNGGHYPEYTDEKTGLQKNEDRCKWITTYISGLADIKKGNVFCLVDGVAFGKRLSKMIPGSIYVHGKDKKEVRKEVYDLFKNNDNIIVFASIGIASTGLNIKRIFNLVFIDIGKSFIRVIQTIGRGLRKAKDKDSVRVTDISSDFKYGKIHLRERIRFYKEAGYPHKKQVVKYNNTLDILDE